MVITNFFAFGGKKDQKEYQKKKEFYHYIIQGVKVCTVKKNLVGIIKKEANI